MMYEITAPHYCAGLIVKDGVVVEAAPILRWAIGKAFTNVLSYFIRKQYRVYAYD